MQQDSFFSLQELKNCDLGRLISSTFKKRVRLRYKVLAHVSAVFRTMETKAEPLILVACPKVPAVEKTLLPYYRGIMSSGESTFQQLHFTEAY